MSPHTQGLIAFRHHRTEVRSKPRPSLMLRLTLSWVDIFGLDCRLLYAIQIPDGLAQLSHA